MDRHATHHRAFENSLVIASTVPYLIYLLFCWSRNTSGGIGGLAGLVTLLGLLNLFHVSATLYLYFDPEIRARAREFPFGLIILPLCFIVLLPWLIFKLLLSESAASQYSLILIFLGIVTWQAWHFGMQSYGVFSFCSITARRPKRTAVQAKFEKYCIMSGTIGGMFMVYHALTPYSFIKHFQAVDYGLVDSIEQASYVIGGVICVGASAAALVYFLSHRPLFTFNSALIFLISVSFFLPDSFRGFTTYYKNPYDLNSINNLALIHGIQYLVFMGAHAIGQSRRILQEGTQQQENMITKYLSSTGPILALLLCTFFVGRIVLDKGIVSAWAVLIAHYFHADVIDVNIFAVGIIAATGPAHFLVDQQLWKLSKSRSRAWVLSRYSYVLPALQPA